jgi:hypothetical protein
MKADYLPQSPVDALENSVQALLPTTRYTLDRRGFLSKKNQSEIHLTV